MERVLVGGLKHEVHSFVDGVITLDDMRLNGFVAVGDDMMDADIGSGQKFHGARDLARREGVDMPAHLSRDA